MTEEKLYNVFQTEHFEQGEWVQTLAFYTICMDVESLDMMTDARFREVPGRRKQAKYLGVVRTGFPVIRPLFTLSGGSI